MAEVGGPALGAGEPPVHTQPVLVSGPNSTSVPSWPLTGPCVHPMVCTLVPKALPASQPSPCRAHVPRARAHKTYHSGICATISSSERDLTSPAHVSPQGPSALRLSPCPCSDGPSSSSNRCWKPSDWVPLPSKQGPRVSWTSLEPQCDCQRHPRTPGQPQPRHSPFTAGRVGAWPREDRFGPHTMAGMGLCGVETEAPAHGVAEDPRTVSPWRVQ